MGERRPLNSHDEDRGAVVLIIENDQTVIDILNHKLPREGFRVEAVSEGLAAVEQLESVRPDVVLLDILLPDASGLDLCREIRRRSAVPVVMVSMKTSEIDGVVALEAGADDFVYKPLRLFELTARLRAVLRRARPAAPREPRPGLGVGSLRLDADRHEVLLRGRPLRLPLKEYELLKLLMANPGRVLLRDTIINRVWGDDYVGDTRTLDVHVRRLRSKIEDDPSRPRRLVTVRGLGYKLEAAPRPS